jgi:hypothetical protein
MKLSWSLWVKTLVKRIILVWLLGYPLYKYVRTFGYDVSANHDSWAQFGSAMGGIYGPVATLITLYVLYLQLQTQKQMNTYQVTQAELGAMDSNLQFHLTMLTQLLDRRLAGDVTPRLHLRTHFERFATKQLENGDQVELASTINERFPGLVDNWIGIYAAFGGLATLKGTDYEHQFVISRQRLVATLSFPICVALDNYLYSVVHEKVKIPYAFSESVPPRSS